MRRLRPREEVVGLSLEHRWLSWSECRDRGARSGDPGLERADWSTAR